MSRELGMTLQRMRMEMTPAEYFIQRAYEEIQYEETKRDGKPEFKPKDGDELDRVMQGLFPNHITIEAEAEE